MKREEFLKQLEQLLDGISEEEKADALAFYRSYFEDAGEENEESVIAELESPEKVAQSIKKNLGMEKENGSYGMPADQNPEWNKNDDDMFVKSEEAPKEKKGGWSAAAIVLVVLTSPLWLTLLLVVASLLLAVVAILFGIAVAVVAVMASLVFAGFLLIGFGFSTLFTGGVAVGLGLTGAGLLVLGLGILAVLLVVWVSGVFLPWAVRGSIGLCKKPFEKKKKWGGSMKKFTKIMLIIAVSLLGAGLIFCGVSTAMGASVWRMAKNGELRYGNWHIGPVGLYYSSADGDDEEDDDIDDFDEDDDDSDDDDSDDDDSDDDDSDDDDMITDISEYGVFLLRYLQVEQTAALMSLPFEISSWILMQRKLQSKNRMTVRRSAPY